MAGYFDPEVISSIKGYDVKARRIVEGFLLGLHKSPFFGVSSEFRQHREYVMGDDMRHMDWKVFAKTDRYYIKQYESETNLCCQFVLDCSESMTYKGDAPMSKFEYGATAAASLAYLLLLQRDSVGFTFFDEKIRTHIPPKATYSNYFNAVHVMEKLTPAAKTMTGSALQTVGGNLRRRGLVVIISDFLDDAQPLSLGLNRLSFDGHEVVAIHLADPYEQTFPFSGPSIIEGMEDMGKLRCDPSDLRELYLDSRATHMAELRGVCRRLRFDLNEINTKTPFDESLSEILLSRIQTHTR
jgi:uncharacterized protein (DUF58 family)